MLQKLRERFTGKFALAILLLLVVPFAFFGIPYDNIIRGGYAAKVEGIEISEMQLQQAFQETLARYAREGTDIPPELHGLVREAVLTNLIRETLVNAHLSDAGYRVTDEMIAEFIQSIPDFQEDGTFSKQLYYDWLASQAMAPRQFEESQRQALRASQLQRGIGATAFVTPAEYRRYLNLYGEQRRAALATFYTRAEAEQDEVGDEEVTAYYEAHAEEFQAPQSADIAWNEIERRELAEGIEVTEEELAQYYSQVSDRYRQDERRRARHILITFGDDKDAAREQATALAERARAGEPFEDLARQYSEDTSSAQQGGDLGLSPKSQMPGALGDTVFSMRKGAIEGPVES